MREEKKIKNYKRKKIPRGEWNSLAQEPLPRKTRSKVGVVSPRGSTSRGAACPRLREGDRVLLHQPTLPGSEGGRVLLWPPTVPWSSRKSIMSQTAAGLQTFFADRPVFKGCFCGVRGQAPPGTDCAPGFPFRQQGRVSSTDESPG